jgi:hypothetical protein
MSADNGIYIASFDNKKEYRVIHAQAIENLDYFDGEFDQAYEIVRYFRNLPKIFQTKETALIGAHEMEEEIRKSDFPVLEYGVCFICDYPLSMTQYVELAMKSKLWNEHPLAG